MAYAKGEDGVTKDKEHYQVFRDTKGRGLVVYDNFKTGVYKYNADLSVFKTITGCTEL